MHDAGQQRDGASDAGMVMVRGVIASERVRAGDFCRVIEGQRIRLLRGSAGDTLQMTDVMAAHDAEAGEQVDVVRIG